MSYFKLLLPVSICIKCQYIKYSLLSLKRPLLLADDDALVVFTSDGGDKHRFTSGRNGKLP